MNGRPEYGFDDQGRPVGVSWPEQWHDREQLRVGTLQRVEVRRAALRILVGCESRSMSEIAASLGCSRAAISHSFTRLCRALNFESLLKKAPETRRKLSEATRSTWAKKRNPRAGEGPGVSRPQLLSCADDGHSGET